MARMISEWWSCFPFVIFFSSFSKFWVGWPYNTKVSFAFYLGCQHSFISRSPMLPKLIRFSYHHQISSEQKIMFSSQLFFLCNVLNILLITFLIFWTKTKNSHICSINHRFPGASSLGKCRDQCWPGFESWQLLLSFIAHMFIVYKGDRRQKHVQQNLTLPWIGVMLFEVT